MFYRSLVFDDKVMVYQVDVGVKPDAEEIP
jgi:hypothetical protein